MRVSGFIGLIAAIIFPYILFELLRNGNHHMDVVMQNAHRHFYVVSAVSILSTVFGVAVGIAGGRLRNIKVSFLALAFISLAGIFAIHGLSTPGLILNVFQLPGLAAQMSILVASFWLWLSSLSSDNRLIAFLSRWRTYLVPVWTLMLTAVAALIVLAPNAAEAVIPLQGYMNTSVLTATVVILNLYTLTSYYRSYRYSRFPLQLAIACCSGWFLVSQLIMVMGELWKLSWWIYHFLLLLSVIVMLGGLIRQYAGHLSIIRGVHALFTNDPVERMTNFLPPSVKSLILATESKDPYTAGHNFRVTLYAHSIGEEMELPPERLRALVTGTIVHDVGKISIPDSILNRPGRLTPDERSVIEQHPVRGYDMCRNLGFMKEELSIIRSHHEKWDGSGYPDKLQGSQIPLPARIAAVADVYDALTSQRAYREAWSHEQAMAMLQEQSGSHFDPIVVEAWNRVCKRKPEVYQQPPSFAGEAAAPV